MEGEERSRVVGAVGKGWLKSGGKKAAEPRKGCLRPRVFLYCFDEIIPDSSEMFSYNILNDTVDISNA